MPQGYLLRNSTTHGHAQNVRARHAECREQVCSVIGHHSRGVLSRGLVRLTHTAIVRHDDAIVLGKGLDLQPPQRPRTPQPHQEHEGWTIAIDFIVHHDLARLHSRHALILSPLGSYMTPVRRLYTMPLAWIPWVVTAIP